MLSFKTVIIFTTCLAWSFCDDSRYCSLCQDHTLCKYTDSSSNCKNSGISGVTESEIKEIVDAHNFFRRTVATGNEKRGLKGGQPKAANLRKIVWDNEMARVAQRWADQCHFGHDSCRLDPRWYVGQNIYWASQSTPYPLNWTHVVNSWYEEVDKFDSKDVDNYRFDTLSGHYTQVIWHETHSIGCGRKDYGNEKLCVCNYGPGGNIIGTPVYTKGEPCSSCPQGTFCENFLCGDGTLKFKSETPPHQETNANWRNNVIHEEVKTRSESQGATDDDDIDENTKKEIQIILDQIENLLISVVKRYKTLNRV